MQRGELVPMVEELGERVVNSLKFKEEERDRLRQEYAALERVNGAQRAEKLEIDFPPCPLCGAVNRK